MSTTIQIPAKERADRSTLPWSLWLRQVCAVFRMEVEKNFLGRCAILIYLLALLAQGSGIFGLWSLSRRLSSSGDMTLQPLQETKTKKQRPKTISLFEENMHPGRYTAIYCIAKILGLLS